jgi:DNA-directed RNA polymerase specialized sigma24 family protein
MSDRTSRLETPSDAAPPLVTPSSPTPSPLTNYVLDLIRHKTHAVAQRNALSREDIEDIKQDLAMHVIERAPSFDPERGTYNTFVSRIVDHRLLNLLRVHHYERSHRDNELSLDDVIHDSENGQASCGDTVDQDSYDHRTDRYSRPAQDRMELSIDIASIVDDLPPMLKHAVSLLLTQGPSDAAHAMKMSQATFYRKVIAPLRTIFVRKGLSEYFSETFSDNLSSEFVCN